MFWKEVKMSNQSLNNTIATLITSIWPVILAVAIFITFIAVVMTGFDIIFNRKDEEKRKEALKSFLYIAIGVVFVVGSLFLTNVILQMASGVANNLEASQDGTNQVNENVDLSGIDNVLN